MDFADHASSLGLYLDGGSVLEDDLMTSLKFDQKLLFSESFDLFGANLDAIVVVVLCCELAPLDQVLELGKLSFAFKLTLLLALAEALLEL